MLLGMYQKEIKSVCKKGNFSSVVIESLFTTNGNGLRIDGWTKGGWMDGC